MSIIQNSSVRARFTFENKFPFIILCQIGNLRRPKRLSVCGQLLDFPNLFCMNESALHLAQNFWEVGIKSNMKTKQKKTKFLTHLPKMGSGSSFPGFLFHFFFFFWQDTCVFEFYNLQFYLIHITYSVVKKS